MNKKQIKTYMKIHHPEYQFYNNSDSWIKPGTGLGITHAEAVAEAEAELESAENSIALIPK